MNEERTEELHRIRDRFRLLERIATGATAEVWRARDDQLDRPVAVKLLHPHLLPDDRSRRRFESEARSVAALSHPGIVEVYDVDVEGERPALVLELVDGESLAARLAREGRLPEREAARIAAELGDALLHAHQRGVVHRDVKPGNILLDASGRARLVDFGIARSLAESTDRLTMIGTVVGTPRYMAPEQLADDAVGPRTDVYALGVVLHEALAGSPPFDASAPLALMGQQRSGAPRLEGVDPALQGIVDSALALDPAQRPGTAGAMADALRDWLAGRPVATPGRAADTETQTAAVPAVAAAPAVAVTGAGGGGSRLRAGPVLLGLGLALGAAATVVLLVLALGQPTEAPPAGAAPTDAATPTPAPTPEPPQGDEAANPGGNRGQSGRLPPPVARLVDEYYEECGEDAPPPPDLAGMGKKHAEELMEPLIEACEEADDD